MIYYGVWRRYKDVRHPSNIKDSNGKDYPFPVVEKNMYTEDWYYYIFERLKSIKHFCEYRKYPKKYKCLLCGRSGISNGCYIYDNKIGWDDGLLHYIKVHKITLEKEFIEWVNNFFVSTLLIKSKKKNSLKLNSMQLNVMDALIKHGSNDKYYEHDGNFYFSEHYGMLDFNKNGLEKITLDTNLTRKVFHSDKNSENIILPQSETDLHDYEYIFHTHPTSKERKKQIIYEWPSHNDIQHFVKNAYYNSLQGSIVVAPEGIYILYMKEKNFPNYIDTFDIEEKGFELLEKAFQKYTGYSENRYYTKIINDRTYLNEWIKVFPKYLGLKYYPKMKNKMNQYVYPTITLPISVKEPKNYKLLKMSTDKT